MEHNSSKMSCIIRMIFSVQTVKIKIVYFVGARRGNAITAKLEIKYLLRNERALQKTRLLFNNSALRIRGFRNDLRCTGLPGNYRLSFLQQYRRYRFRLFGQYRCGRIVRPADPKNPCYPNQRKQSFRGQTRQNRRSTVHDL